MEKGGRSRSVVERFPTTVPYEPFTCTSLVYSRVIHSFTPFSRSLDTRTDFTMAMAETTVLYNGLFPIWIKVNLSAVSGFFRKKHDRVALRHAREAAAEEEEEDDDRERRRTARERTTSLVRESAAS